MIFDIAGMGFGRFESYVGIRYATHEEEAANGYRSSVIFRVYVDEEVTPRFESGVMHTRTPMEFAGVDITGAETPRIEVDACGDQSADTELYARFALLEINLLPGASVRLQEPVGLRFESVIDAGMYEALTAAGYTVTFCTWILDRVLCTGGWLTEGGILATPLPASDAAP